MVENSWSKSIKNKYEVQINTRIPLQCSADTCKKALKSNLSEQRKEESILWKNEYTKESSTTQLLKQAFFHDSCLRNSPCPSLFYLPHLFPFFFPLLLSFSPSSVVLHLIYSSEELLDLYKSEGRRGGLEWPWLAFPALSVWTMAMAPI